MQRLHRGGVRSIRLHISWGAVQPKRNGEYDWEATDAAVVAAVRAGFEVLPVLDGAPRWAVHPGPVPGTGGSATAVRHLPAHGRAGRAWKQFVRAAVARYGPRGTLWSERLDLPSRPIRTWQIWNEENFKYFVQRPRPGEYGRLVKISDAALRGADRGARIVLGGLFARPGRSDPRIPAAARLLRRRLPRTDVSQQPGDPPPLRGRRPAPLRRQLPAAATADRRSAQVLRRNHDGRKGLWITELGWSSERPSRDDAFAVGWRGQARQLRGAFRLLRQNQRRWRIRRVYWFSVDDLDGSCNFCGGSGLFRSRSRAKPAWHAYVHFAGGTVR